MENYSHNVYIAKLDMGNCDICTTSINSTAKISHIFNSFNTYIHLN